jgi:hypothetical protein
VKVFTIHRAFDEPASLIETRYTPRTACGAERLKADFISSPARMLNGRTRTVASGQRALVQHDADWTPAVRALVQPLPIAVNAATNVELASSIMPGDGGERRRS